jgi:tetratricopeptide (TPR) repeat protein
MSERIDGPGNLNQPAMQVELGDLLRARAAWAAAEEAYVSALTTLDKTPGGTAADMPAALEGLARVQWAKGERAPAEAAVRREIGLYEAYISSDHPQLAPALELLAEILAASGREGEAKPALARAAAIRKMTR